MMNKKERQKGLGQLKAPDFETIANRAEELMNSRRLGCSESLMLAFQETLGDEIVPPVAVALSSPFRGGLGGAGCICGALAAGQMILGLALGFEGRATDEQNLGETARARECHQQLHDLFKKKHRSTCCRVLTKNLEPKTPERHRQCLSLVKSSAGLTGEVLTRGLAHGEEITS